MNDKLYVILPYFNFVGYKSNERNLNIFLKNFKSYSNVELIIVEGFIEENAQLDDFSDQVFKHIKVKLRDVLWVKENLINIGFSSLKDWQYGCWIDRDIQFANPDWALESIEKLKTYDVMQPFNQCIYLDKDFTISKENTEYFKNKGYYHITSFCEWFSNLEMREKPNTLGHAGHAWCINRNFYDKIGGMFDKCIVGGGDGFLAQAMKQNFGHFHYRLFGNAYKNYCEKTKYAKVCYLNGLIMHNYHGEIKERNYASRQEVFYKKGFNIETDLEYNNGVLCLSESGKKFEKEIRDYFISRKEDGLYEIL
jgi:hypothetical protein